MKRQRSPSHNATVCLRLSVYAPVRTCLGGWGARGGAAVGRTHRHPLHRGCPCRQRYRAPRSVGAGGRLILGQTGRTGVRREDQHRRPIRLRRYRWHQKTDTFIDKEWRHAAGTVGGIQVPQKAEILVDKGPQTLPACSTTNQYLHDKNTMRASSGKVLLSLFNNTQMYTVSRHVTL